MAKLIIKKSIEIYGDEYVIGQRIPYIYRENYMGKEHELFDVLLKDIDTNGLITVCDKNETFHIWLHDIEESKDMHRFEYRTITGSYYSSHQGIVYAKTPQEAAERLKETSLKRVWSKKYSDWQGDISYLELFYNGLSCPVKDNTYMFPEAYKDLNVTDSRFANQAFLQNIADNISEWTRISNEFAGNCNDSLTWDFDYGTSYMTNCGGNGLYFTIADDKGFETWSLATANPNKFVKEVCVALEKELTQSKECEEKEQ